MNRAINVSLEDAFVAVNNAWDKQEKYNEYLDIPVYFVQQPNLLTAYYGNICFEIKCEKKIHRNNDLTEKILYLQIMAPGIRGYLFRTNLSSRTHEISADKCPTYFENKWLEIDEKYLNEHDFFQFEVAGALLISSRKEYVKLIKNIIKDSIYEN